MDRYAFYACHYIDREGEIPFNRQYRYCYQKLEGEAYEFCGYYSDKRYIASERRRNGLMQLLKDCQDGKFDRVLMNDINRMALNRDNLVEIVRRFQHAGVEIYLNLGKAAPLSIQLADEIRRAEDEEMFLAAQEWEARQDTEFDEYVAHQESAQQTTTPIVTEEDAQRVKALDDAEQAMLQSVAQNAEQAAFANAAQQQPQEPGL